VCGKCGQVSQLHIAEACSEAHIRAASEETLCLLQKPKNYDCVRKNPVLAHVLSQLNPAHMVPFSLLKINFVIYVVIKLLSLSAALLQTDFPLQAFQQNICRYTHTHTHIFTYIHIYTHVLCIYIYIYIYTHTHIYIYI